MDSFVTLTAFESEPSNEPTDEDAIPVPADQEREGGSGINCYCVVV